MSHARLDDRFRSHPKVVAAGESAAWLWACGIGYCSEHLTDGFIPSEQVRVLYPFKGSPEKLAKRLCEVGLWQEVDGGFLVLRYLKHNDSAVVVKERQEKAKKRKEEYEARRSGNVPGTRSVAPPSSDPERDENAVPNASGTRPSRARTSPLISSGSSSEDKSSSDPPAPTRGGKRKRAQPLPETPIPDDWAPNARHFEWARTSPGVEFSEATVEAEAAKFVDHAKANGRLQVDWDAAFRTWLRNARKWAPDLPRAIPRPAGTGDVPPMRPEIQRRYEESLLRGDDVAITPDLFTNIGRGGVARSSPEGEPEA